MTARAAPPEAALLKTARETAHLKVHAAAALAGISKARWSQVENARETRQGVVKVAEAKPVTVAHMARAVGLTPDELTAAGVRPEAVTVLRAILAQEQARAAMRAEDPPASEPASAVPLPAVAAVSVAVPGLDGDEADVWAELQRALPPGEVIFPGNADEAQRWDALEPLTDIPDLVKCIAFFRRTDPRRTGGTREDHAPHRAAS